MSKDSPKFQPGDVAEVVSERGHFYPLGLMVRVIRYLGSDLVECAPLNDLERDRVPEWARSGQMIAVEDLVLVEAAQIPIPAAASIPPGLLHALENLQRGLVAGTALEIVGRAKTVVAEAISAGILQKRLRPPADYVCGSSDLGLIDLAEYLSRHRDVPEFAAALHALEDGKAHKLAPLGVRLGEKEREAGWPLLWARPGRVLREAGVNRARVYRRDDLCKLHSWLREHLRGLTF